MVQAQEKPQIDLKADLVSKYIWRGMDLGDASVQPTLGVTWKGLNLEAWGSVGITNSNDPCTEMAYFFFGFTLNAL